MNSEQLRDPIIKVKQWKATGNIYERGSNGWLPTGDHEEVDKAKYITN